MDKQVNQLVIGTVTNVKPYALFFEFEDGSRGLLHISEISDSFIKDIEKYGSVGDKIKVMIVSVDESNGFLRLSLKKVPQEERYSTHSNQRKIPVMGEEEFKPLKDKLPQWIDATLKIAKEDK